MPQHSWQLIARAALPDQPTFWELLEFLGIGIAMVLLALSFLAASVGGLARVIAWTAHRPARASHSSEELPPQLIAVLAAAIAVALDEPHRILHIRPVAPEDNQWSLEGRIRHHVSHQVRRGRS